MSFNPAVFSLKRRTTLVVLTLILVGAGLVSYGGLGRLEDPAFTIKTAMVLTAYPGASPREVEEEVTDVIEEAVQSMGQVESVHSTSQEGLSIVFVEMEDRYEAPDLPQVWDELRRKVGDAQAKLPPGAGPSLVKDDFGDVYGLLFAVTGEGYSYAQLKDYAEGLKKELLLCRDVAKIDFWGTQQERLYVEFRRSRLAELGLSPDRIGQILTSQNLVRESGNLDVGDLYTRVTPTGDFAAEEAVADILIGGEGGLVRLGDVATLSRGYVEPPGNLMRLNGRPAIGLGISTVAGGNVVEMGKAVKKRLAELEGFRPVGMELVPIYYQSDMVVRSVNQFIVNLLESVAIVLGLLMLFMGWQSGLLIGFILILTILTTFIGMSLLDIELQKVSLGALVLALGMLVDNAIVVADGILVRVERGQSREAAACDVVRETQWPLLGATVVAILAFGAVGFAPGDVGEFCRSLFQVMALSLSFSWVLAVTVTPLLCVLFLKVPDGGTADPYDGPFYRIYRRLVHLCLKGAPLSAAVVVVLFALSVAFFGKIPLSFFPPSTQPYFYVNVWKPQGTAIEATSRTMEELEAFVRGLDGVRNVTAFVGEGTLRFLLTYNYESPNSSYGQLLVEVDDYRQIDGLVLAVERQIKGSFSGEEIYCSRVMTGPSKPYTVEVRFRGPDAAVLKDLARRGEAVMRAHGGVRDIRTDWRHPLFVVRPQFSESRARRAGTSRYDLAGALQWAFNGTVAGIYREGTELIPIVARPVEEERLSVEQIEDVQVWSGAAGAYVPLRQVVSSVERVWEDPLVRRRNRQRTVTLQANPVVGLAEPLRRELREAVEAIPLPSGYSMEWAGEYADSQDAQRPLMQSFPFFLGAMFFILIVLFDSVRRPLIVFLTVPLSAIGVTAAFLLTGQPFGFMPIVGFLGLSGMLIKNAIVLIDQIELDRTEGKAPYRAILDSAVSRLRPVTMAAGTTILGVIPLLTDPLYAGMAVTIMGGLCGGTFLTLIVVPVLYRLVFRIAVDDSVL
ncbi:efflux RND transporter permease subunit [Aminirod propionatiphilus]|uniref:Efflux RND transporter permease subunit n=1 Tax=Aminirod propionatiphilus TaxID=3415223 RepID=A0ACD1DWC6_9BACT|nr:efflux RND transporter permease subunit [Synergistota bacterium]